MIRDFFYVGGEYVEDENGKTFMQGQMYVEHLVPASVYMPYPIVLIHGSVQTGTVRRLLPMLPPTSRAAP